MATYTNPWQFISGKDLYFALDEKDPSGEYIYLNRLRDYMKNHFDQLKTIDELKHLNFEIPKIKYYIGGMLVELKVVYKGRPCFNIHATFHTDTKGSHDSQMHIKFDDTTEGNPREYGGGIKLFFKFDNNNIKIVFSSDDDLRKYICDYNPGNMQNQLYIYTIKKETKNAISKDVITFNNQKRTGLHENIETHADIFKSFINGLGYMFNEMIIDGKPILRSKPGKPLKQMTYIGEKEWEQKYLKYKQKYLELKKKLNMV
jgi:hypothetical protein